MHNGVVVEAGGYHGWWMQEIIRRLRGHHEPQEEMAFHSVIERLRSDTPEPTMVELGSFWSYYALWAQNAIPKTKCILVEPDPNNLELGRRNFALNGAQGTFINGAAGIPNGQTIKLRCESDLAVRDLPVVGVDDLIKNENLERIDLLLSDVQGAEVDMLDSASNALSSGKIRFLVVSTHHHSISGDTRTHERCREKLISYGAHIIAEHSTDESCSGDGLIVASLDQRDRDLRVELSRVEE